MSMKINPKKKAKIKRQIVMTPEGYGYVDVEVKSEKKGKGKKC